MGRWLAKFSAAISELGTDNPDSLPNVSALSGHDYKASAEIQMGEWITWDQGGPAQVEFIDTDEDGTTWIYVSWPGWQSAVNAKYVTAVRTS
ncbi:MAG: hypothetical protein H0V35_15045 [Nitrospira sp.]|nr:hypothetical protein [Nitrospira sp.]